MEERNLIDNTEDRQFEMRVEGKKARLEYIRTKDRIFLTHTEVPAALEGKGVGSSLVKEVLKAVEKEGLALVPLCPFVATYIKEHPQWKSLVFKGIHIG